MDQQVSVVLKSGDRYDIHLTAEELDQFSSSDARFYIGEAFGEAGLETPNPVGKILLLDQILLLAQEQKLDAWAKPTPELRKFAAAVAKSLGRPSVTIDLLNYKL